jgi:hypothetical protein
MILVVAAALVVALVVAHSVLGVRAIVILLSMQDTVHITLTNVVATQLLGVTQAVKDLAVGVGSIKSRGLRNRS